MTDWQDQYLPRRPNPITQSWPSNEVRRQRRVHPTRGTASPIGATLLYLAFILASLLAIAWFATSGFSMMVEYFAAMATHPDCPTPEC